MLEAILDVNTSELLFEHLFCQVILKEWQMKETLEKKDCR